MQGVIVRWMPEKNFGFAHLAGESHEVFVSGMRVVKGELYMGATINFELHPNNHPSERLCATNIRVVSERRK
jgi:cold shock CspA family protein